LKNYRDAHLRRRVLAHATDLSTDTSRHSLPGASRPGALTTFLDILTGGVYYQRRIDIRM